MIGRRLTLLAASTSVLISGPVAAGAQQVPALAGAWEGTLDTGGAGTLRIVFHLAADVDGGLSATMDSPDQGAFGIAAGPVRVEEGHAIRIDVPVAAGYYEGTISDDLSRIDGTWHQGGLSLTLVLEPLDESPPERPQEPEEPFPYAAIEVEFPSVAPGVMLAGTLTMPEEAGPHAAVVLVSGSGAQNRDESVFGHRPFLVLADHLTRQGIAVLRYDDRGVGGSTGDITRATMPDFADDAEGAVRFLRSLPDIDGDRIGMVGHSEGALVAPIVANRSSDVAFVVLLASTGVDGEDLLVMQLIAINRAMGVSEEITRQRSELQKQLLALPAAAPDDSTAAEQVREILAGVGMGEQAIEAQVAALLNPWMHHFLTYDPLPALRELRVPVLALWGSKDMQVPPDGNRPPVEAALAEGGNPDVTLEVLAGLNHLFQTADSGAPAEYSTIEETIAPEALWTISDWIASHAR